MLQIKKSAEEAGEEVKQEVIMSRDDAKEWMLQCQQVFF